MSTGMMIPAGRQMPSMMGRRTSGTTFGTTSSGLMLSETDLLFSLTGRDMYVKEDAGEQNPVVNGQHQHQQHHHHQNHLNQQVESDQDNTQGEVGRVQEDDQFESKSGSDNLEGVSGDDLQDPNYRPTKKKKRYHRHTQRQIQEMESFFKECPHPDDKLRKELSRELGLEPLQVKFWFQNKRTQMKTQNERSENTILRNENEKLRAENMRYRETVLANISCPNCGGPTAIGEMPFDEQHLRIENSRLKEEIDRLSGTTAAKYVNKPIPPNQFPSRHHADLLPGTASDFFRPPSDLIRPVGNAQHDLNKPAVVKLAVAAMEELVRLAQVGEPLWVPGGSESDNPNEVLNEEEYLRSFPRVIGPRPFGLRSEASRDSAVVIMNHVSLVEMLMDVNQWSTVFSGIVSKATMVQVLSTGVAGNFNGAIQVVSAETQLPTPLVPTRETHFIRYCKQHSDKSWAVVDVSLDETLRPNQSMIRSRRRPSGCLIKELPNGYSKVIWVEHVEVEDQSVHQMYKSLVNSCLGFGAKRWISALERQCERLASLMATNIPSGEIGVITNQEGRRSVMKLAERMVTSFYNGVSASTTHQWTTLSGSGAGNVRVMTRKSIDDLGRPSGIILSAATSFWIPTPPCRVFDFLRDENSRSEWDILSNSGIVQEMAHIANGQEQGNCVSLLRVNSASSNQSNMLILQETSTDPTGSFVVYAPVDIVAMNVVLNGGDPDYVALLPSGFAILPDGSGGGGDGGGSLLTVAFQILVDSVPTAKLSLGSVATVNSLISCTVERIKGALVGKCG